MTTNDEQYREALGYYTRGRDEGYPLNPDLITGEGGDEYRADFDRFLARVRRDAEDELDSWMTRAYEAEGKLWKAEARIRHLEDTARVIVKEVLAAEDARDEHRRGEAAAEARIAEEKHLRMKATAAATEAEARIKAVRELHVPDRPLDKYPDCAECTIHGYCEDDAPVEWPCPTIRALDG